MEVRESPIEGHGLFASAAFDPGELVAIIGGTPYRDDELEGGGPTAHSSVAIGEGLNLVQEADDPLQFGNHSCDPNTWLKDEVTQVARRAIEAGDEITVDYALMSGYSAWSMACNCGAPSCRGRVTGDDWRRPDLREAYRGHFSPFLERRIAALGEDAGT